MAIRHDGGRLGRVTAAPALRCKIPGRSGSWLRASRLLAQLTLLAGPLNAALADSPAVDQSHSATKACLAGVRTHAYSPASSACWTVYSAAMAANDYVSAAVAVELGCERDRRPDFCAFMSHWGVTVASVRQATTSAAKYAIRRAAEHAEAVVTTAEIEDVELQLARAEVARLPKSKSSTRGAGGVLAKHSAGPQERRASRGTSIALSSRTAQPAAQAAD